MGERRKKILLGFAVKLVYAASWAVLVQFEPFWMLALVFCCGVGSFLAFCACQVDDYPRFVLCHRLFPLTAASVQVIRPSGQQCMVLRYL